MKRFGLLIPSSNVVIEALIQQAIDDATIHISRLRVLDVKLEETSRAQFELETQLIAAKLLCDAKVDAVVWGGNLSQLAGDGAGSTVYRSDAAANWRSDWQLCFGNQPPA